MAPIQFKIHSLETAREARGVAVVIDVLRAFTTAAVATALGAKEIRCVGTIEDALALKRELTNVLVMGEVDGYAIPEFDLNNSPLRLRDSDIRGKTLIQRTTAGTQGLIRAENAEILFAAALVTASATAERVRALDPREVHFIATGITADGRGDEDVACAEVIRDLILGLPLPDPEALAERIRASKNGLRFSDPASRDLPAGDLDIASELDRFDFTLSAIRLRDGSIRLMPKKGAGA